MYCHIGISSTLAHVFTLGQESAKVMLEKYVTNLALVHQQQNIFILYSYSGIVSNFKVKQKL